MLADPAITLSWGLALVTDEAGARTLTLRLTGRLGTRGARLLREGFDGVVAPGTQVHLDLGDVDYISSAGLSALAELARAHSLSGGSIAMSAASEPARLALRLAPVDGLRPPEA